MKTYHDAEILGTGTEEVDAGILASFHVKLDDGTEQEAKTFLTGKYSQFVVDTLAQIGIDAKTELTNLDKSIGKKCRVSVEESEFGPKVYLCGPRKKANPATEQALRAAMAKLAGGSGDDPF